MTWDPESTAPEPDAPVEDDAAAQPEAERVRTGVGRVDEVIRSVEELEERPIEEHVGVFETAHSQLRRALDHTDDDADGAEGTDAGPDDGAGA